MLLGEWVNVSRSITEVRETSMQQGAFLNKQSESEKLYIYSCVTEPSFTIYNAPSIYHTCTSLLNSRQFVHFFTHMAPISRLRRELCHNITDPKLELSSRYRY